MTGIQRYSTQNVQNYHFPAKSTIMSRTASVRQRVNARVVGLSRKTSDNRHNSVNSEEMFVPGFCCASIPTT